MESIITLPFSCIKYYCLSFPSAQSLIHPMKKRASPRLFHQTTLYVPKHIFSRETITHLWKNPLFLTFSGPLPDHSSGKHCQNCQHKHCLYRHFQSLSFKTLENHLKSLWCVLQFPELCRLRISLMNFNRQLIRTRKSAPYQTSALLLISSYQRTATTR